MTYQITQHILSAKCRDYRSAWSWWQDDWRLKSRAIKKFKQWLVQCINTALLKLFKRGFFWENGLILLCNIFKVSHVPPAIKSWPTLRNGKEPKYSWSRRDQKKNCTHLWLMAMGISRSRFALKNRNFARPDHHLQYIYEYNHLPSF